MDIETALETQRFRLLRLLAGLVFALKFVSFAPAGSMMPHWVRRYVSSVLVRAEFAAQCLVFACARVLFGRRAVEAAVGSAPALRPFEDFTEDGLSTALLLRRIAALQTVLRDLPRYARRLVQRCLKTRPAPARYEMPSAGKFPAPCAAADTRIDRPPDIFRLPSKEMCFHPYRMGGRRRALRSGPLSGQRHAPEQRTSPTRLNALPAIASRSASSAAITALATSSANTNAAGFCPCSNRRTMSQY